MALIANSLHIISVRCYFDNMSEEVDSRVALRQCSSKKRFGCQVEDCGAQSITLSNSSSCSNGDELVSDNEVHDVSSVDVGEYAL